MFITYLSVIIILFGWAYQLYFTYKGKKEIQNYFLIAFGIGLLLMLISDLFQGFKIGSVLSAINLIMVGLILFYKKK